MPPPQAQPALRVYIDVTDTLRTGWNAGIQRVVRGVATRLGDDPRLDVVCLIWSSNYRGFRPATPEEMRRLAVPVPTSATPTEATAVPERRRLRRGFHVALNRLGVGPPLRRSVRAARLRLRPTPEQRRERAVVQPVLRPGSVFLDMDAVWNVVDAPRAALLPRLRSQGVRIVPFVYDLLPVEHPEWFVDSLVQVFVRAVRAQLAGADLVLAISESTAESVRRWAATVRAAPIAVRVVALGAEAPAGAPLRSEAGTALPIELQDRPYLLVVGTVEPRKNQATVLEAFELVAGARNDLHLVVVGKSGWRAEQVVARLRRATGSGRVHWYEGIGDHDLHALYDHAFLVLVPSLTEGFGLPVLEALQHGVPVVSSPGGALVEVGSDLVEFADPLDPAAWAEIISRHLGDPAHHAEMVARAASVEVRSWDDVARTVADVLTEQFTETGGPRAGSGAASRGS